MIADETAPRDAGVMLDSVERAIAEIVRLIPSTAIEPFSTT